jgi:hypothetical protein
MATSTSARATVLIAILAKDKAYSLPLYLDLILKSDYPKEYIGLYIRSNNNNDNTITILKDWTDQHRQQYIEIYEDYSNVKEKVGQYKEHEWNATRFKVLANIRQKSLDYAYDRGYDYYFVVDCDNFIHPETLPHLISLNKDIVGPFLRKDTLDYYSNYHHCVDDNGYFSHCGHYEEILNQKIKGQIQVDVIHCTYLISRDCIPKISYIDQTGRYEYVIFSDSCRRNNVDQWIDNTRIWGYLTFYNIDTFDPAKIAEMLKLWPPYLVTFV